MKLVFYAWIFVACFFNNQFECVWHKFKNKLSKYSNQKEKNENEQIALNLIENKENGLFGDDLDEYFPYQDVSAREFYYTKEEQNSLDESSDHDVNNTILLNKSQTLANSKLK